MKYHLFVILSLTGLGSGAAMPQGCEMAARSTLVFTAPPGGVPTNGMPGGPLLGNGDVGVVLAGPPEAQVLYIGKNDFWTSSPARAKVINVGRVELSIPALQGAVYRQEQDLARAEVRGTFTKDALVVRTRSWVDANENLLVTQIGCEGAPVTFSVQAVSGVADRVPTRVADSGTLNIGREQHGGGRWYFDGEISGLVVTNAVLSGQVSGQPGTPERFDGRTTWRAGTAPAMDKSVSVAAWIKIAGTNPEANYIVSKGEWNRAYSLGLSNGRLRWTINGTMLQTGEPLVKDKWLYVAGTFDGDRMCAYVDGELKASLGDRAGASTWFTRKADAPEVVGREAAVVARVVGAEGREVTIKPGTTVTVATAILSDLDASNSAGPQRAETADSGAARSGPIPTDVLLAVAQKRVASLTAMDIDALSTKHRAWWTDFWARSFIEIPDKEIEKRWYAALYTMASCSRPGKVAPGLWGNWLTTDSPNWQGDFHLNYNFQAPFYMVYGSNHADVSLPFFQPVMDWMPQARDFAREHGWKGVHYPVSIGPWASCSYSPRLDLGQRSNAAYVSLSFIWYWQYTQDTAWLKTTGYPYLSEVAAFWEDYLKFENGRYVIYNDAIHEGSGDNMNPILSLGLVRNLFKNMIPMSEELGVDAEKRAKWRDILDKISAFPLQEHGGKTVFRYSERGTAWWRDNTLGIQHIFPAGAIGLDSDPKLLEISHNMINAMNRWADYNGFSSWYTACARVGYDPNVILKRLRAECDKHSFPNGLLYYGGGGIESCGGFLAINEMLLQSHEGVIRFFPCWPADQDAKFGSLRAVGAFLVSAELKNGEVTGVKIVSEKGRDCTVQNPWPGRKVKLRGRETLDGLRFTFKTAANEILELEPL